MYITLLDLVSDPTGSGVRLEILRMLTCITHRWQVRLFIFCQVQNVIDCLHCHQSRDVIVRAHVRAAAYIRRSTHGLKKIMTPGNQVHMSVRVVRLMDSSSLQIPDSTYIGRVDSSF